MRAAACTALRNIPRPAIRWRFFTAIFPRRSTAFARRLPDPNLKPDYNKRFKMHGYNKIEQEYAHQLYKDWTGPDFPRMVMIEIQHANPYYDDSYAVNSANLGPYGDAITYELIPEVEKQFRCLGAGWARFLYGGSTGGWESLAVQIFYPDEYNGCWVACPDPIDFRAYTVVNLYEHKNAYYLDSQFAKTPRPGMRNYLGEVGITLEDMNRRELVLGTNSRSGDQWDIWQAVYSPVGDDGYPKPIWDKVTGQIDHSVAEYWREHYDLGHILQRDWPKIGKKLQGKIHIYCGDMDNYYLNNAVYLVEEFLKSTKDPHYDGEVVLRRPRRTLLERRSDAAQRILPPALPSNARTEDPRRASSNRRRRARISRVGGIESLTCSQSASIGSQPVRYYRLHEGGEPAPWLSGLRWTPSHSVRFRLGRHSDAGLVDRSRIVIPVHLSRRSPVGRERYSVRLGATAHVAPPLCQRPVDFMQSLVRKALRHMAHSLRHLAESQQLVVTPSWSMHKARPIPRRSAPQFFP